MQVLVQPGLVARLLVVQLTETTAMHESVYECSVLACAVSIWGTGWLYTPRGCVWRGLDERCAERETELESSQITLYTHTRQSRICRTCAQGRCCVPILVPFPSAMAKGASSSPKGGESAAAPSGLSLAGQLDHYGWRGGYTLVSAALAGLMLVGFPMAMKEVWPQYLALIGADEHPDSNFAFGA